MRIDTSSISMASTRSCQEEARLTQVTVTRRRGAGGEEQQASLRAADVHIKRYEAGGGVSLFTSSQSGLTAAEEPQEGIHSVQSKVTDQSRQTSAPVIQNPAPISIQAPDAKADWLDGITDSINSDPKIQILRKCLELLERATGKPVTNNTRLGNRTVGDILHLSPSSVSQRYQETMSLSASQSLTVSRITVQNADGQLELPRAQTLNSQNANPNGYWTRQVISSGFVKGEEHTAFSSTGTVVTSDGRAIDFGVSLEMSRSFEIAVDTAGKEEIYTDPLVINLDTDAAALSDVAFYFDLDRDGRKEELSSLASGSGFLALDKNGDGEINDGSELFGARTGDGFGELAQYDQDGNGWIDENDDVFSRLSVWTRCGGGEPKLLSLAGAGVGAIFLGSQSTQFTLAAPSGEEAAQVRRTGLYLKESGQVGTVQHLDFKT